MQHKKKARHFPSYTWQMWSRIARISQSNMYRTILQLIICKPLLLSIRLTWLSYDTKAAAPGWAHLMILKQRHHMLGMSSMTTHWTPNASASHSMAADRALERIIFAFPANICLIHRRQTFLTYGCKCDTGNSRIWNYTRRFLLICVWLWHYFRTATRNTVRQALWDLTSDRENTPSI